MNKNLDVILGGQFGSEGKGLVAGWLGKVDYDVIISTNSAQAGHTVYYKGNKVVTRHIPSAAVFNHSAQIYLAPGSIINPDVLIEELDMLEGLGIPIRDRLFVSGRATIITPECIHEEESEKKWEAIGSTCEGVGAALARRVRRKDSVIAGMWFIDKHALRLGGQVVGNEWHFGLVDEIRSGKILVLLEGSQGWGLSVYGPYFPFCTSRDTSLAGIMSAAQLPVNNIRDVYGVYRTFPIRVAGNSGPLKDELSWGHIAEISGYETLQEITTVTKRVRRVGAFDFKFYVESVIANGVTKPVITFMNYLDHTIENARYAQEMLTGKTSPFLMSLAHLVKSASIPFPAAISANKESVVPVPDEFWTKNKLVR